MSSDGTHQTDDNMAELTANIDRIQRLVANNNRTVRAALSDMKTLNKSLNDTLARTEQVKQGTDETTADGKEAGDESKASNDDDDKTNKTAGEPGVTIPDEMGITIPADLRETLDHKLTSVLRMLRLWDQTNLTATERMAFKLLGILAADMLNLCGWVPDEQSVRLLKEMNNWSPPATPVNE